MRCVAIFAIVPLVVPIRACADEPPAKPVAGPLGMQFVRLPKGTFFMGWDSIGKRSKKTEIASDFEIAIYPTTQEQWQTLMGNNPSEFSRTGEGKDKVINVPDADLKQFPVENVSWNDAGVYQEAER